MEIYAHIGGTPLGMAFDRYDNLYVCIGGMGLYMVTPQRAVHKITDEQWDAMLNVHLKAPFQMIRAASPYFREPAKAESANRSISCRARCSSSGYDDTARCMESLRRSSASDARSTFSRTVRPEKSFVI